MKVQERELTIVHDYWLQLGGAERVVTSLHRLFPQSPLIFSAVHPARLPESFRQAGVKTTWMQVLPGLLRYHKFLYWLFPSAFASLPSVTTKLALVSSSGYAKWCRFSPETKVVCYCHTPPRFLWQKESYLENEIQNPWLRKFVSGTLSHFQKSDLQQSKSIGLFIANSRCVQERILEFYGRSSRLIHPPVETSRFSVTDKHDDTYLIVSRLVAYKKVDYAVAAFARNGKRLLIIGEGPDRQRLEKAAGPGTRFLGRLSDQAVREKMENCRALIFPGSEDFGITPLEANACGKPVLALAEGGALETIRPGLNGLLYAEATASSLNEAIVNLEKKSWDGPAIRRHAETFDESVFHSKILQLMEEVASTGNLAALEKSPVQ